MKSKPLQTANWVKNLWKRGEKGAFVSFQFQHDASPHTVDALSDVINYLKTGRRKHYLMTLFNTVSHIHLMATERYF